MAQANTLLESPTQAGTEGPSLTHSREGAMLMNGNGDGYCYRVCIQDHRSVERAKWDKNARMRKMDDFDPALSFGASVAAHYDDHRRGDEEDAAAFLAGFADEGSALEFAIGTGRIALPLAAKGVQVDGIELSPHMVEQLHAKPEGRNINVVIGDMCRATTHRHYPLVYLVFNTIFHLLTADDQIRCFENATRHLTPGGHFVVEAALPHAWISPDRSDYVHTEYVGSDTVVLDVARYDPVTQLLEENHVRFTTQGITMRPIVCRLITPGEMDLMARMAGMRLIHRFADWRRAAFDSNSKAHVSVYGF
jgi:SAM-dependent methyltransferase